MSLTYIHDVEQCTRDHIDHTATLPQRPTLLHTNCFIMSDLFDIRKQVLHTFQSTFSSDTCQQLAFYGSYHSNPINIAIHILFVPLIMWYGP